jgi:CRISPR-associated endonuclease Cas2
MSLYIAACDISDDDRRQSAAHVLLRYGERLQQSVYELWLEPEQVRILCREIGPLLAVTDSFYIFPIDERGSRATLAWQRPPAVFQPVIED